MRMTLRIKKIYFDRILNNTKIVEYRSYKPFYKNLENATSIMFYYQTTQRLLVDVISVKIIKKPEFLNQSKINFTDQVYEILIKNPRLII